MRLVFLGTPEPAVTVLRAVAARHEVVLVITRPDRRRGRGGTFSASPVKLAALELGLRVGHRLDELEGEEAQLGVVVAYGAMIPAAVLDRTPMLNVHFSLLPRWRGAAPVERAILAGDLETGVSIMMLDTGLDTGPVYLERRVRIDEKSTADLTHELADLGAQALLEVLATPSLLANPRVQEGEATYAQKLTAETFHVTPRVSRVEVLRTTRLGRAFTFVEGRRVLILEARSDSARVDPGVVEVRDGRVLLGALDGALVLERVQPEGSRPMNARDWWAGARLEPGASRWA